MSWGSLLASSPVQTTLDPWDNRWSTYPMIHSHPPASSLQLKSESSSVSAQEPPGPSCDRGCPGGHDPGPKERGRPSPLAVGGPHRWATRWVAFRGSDARGKVFFLREDRHSGVCGHAAVTDTDTVCYSLRWATEGGRWARVGCVRRPGWTGFFSFLSEEFFLFFIYLFLIFLFFIYLFMIFIFS